MSTPTSTTPNLGTQGILDPNGQYMLRNRSMFNLLKYLWTGALATYETTTYCARTGITVAHYNKYKTQLDALLATYKTVSATLDPLLSLQFQQINGHCTTFKDVTYPEVVGIADAIWNYAHLASGGGNVNASYYKAIFDTIDKLAACTASDPPSKAVNLKAGINDGINTMVAKITALQEQAAGVKAKFMTFDDDSKHDQANLNDSVTTINTSFKGAGGAIDTLQAQIKKDQQDLEDDIDEHDHDLLLMKTAAAYAWCGPIGAIAAAAVLGTYGVDAANMEAAIESLKTTIAQETTELADDRAILAELGNVKLDLTSMVDLIGPAITAIEEMIGEWGTIASNLLDIQTLLDTNVRELSLFFTSTAVNSILDDWSNVMNVVNDYRLNAYVSSMPKVTTLDQYLTDLAAAKAAHAT
ncbi:hypothetical protein B0H15DRAFT_1004789 [Mycena belliarum]|uniref:Uncharacterized protein n=1 Tax=Mycena belliarum TaxID=1033014 RepID=A0AAD6UCY8_9AGAR|nr:hypothetical protein B0H15DRAFT_1004789 [Mycena belliae]